MFKTESSTIIQRPIEAVWKYLVHVENIPKWDRGVMDARLTSEGPLGVGSTMQFIRQLFGKRRTLDVRYTEYEPNRAFAFEYTSGPCMRSVDRYTLEPAEGGTRLTCSGDIELNGVYKLLSPFLVGMMRKDEAVDIATMKHTLEARA